ncbi:amino acid racemase [Alkaliphilus pronyensis]|uniref:Amino acid racemase n=1 Tax=Alkaliphilus pronyensis TaxID=1482732 RepID=A0A6I0EZP5_9FIRM|nr:amino acid racemase [Alkaliphilus pronyensis]KAB3534797.1 amino acid racemase [Alkaliphilus pronyensis]
MKKIGILGGMGPEATANFFNKVIHLTNGSSDQEHIPIIIENNVLIPDRTEYLLGNGPSPLKYLIKSAIVLELMGADFIVMPCNTAHCFYEDIKEYLDIPILNMVQITADFIKNNYKNTKQVGLLATMGTYSSKIYENYFAHNNIEVIALKKENQKKLQEIIYKIKKGNKQNHKSELINFLKELNEKSIEIVILGCTELPLLFNAIEKDEDIAAFNYRYIDTTLLLAKKSVEYAKL